METSTTPAVIKSIPIEKLQPNPWNRTVFDPQALGELAASLEAEGVLEPLIVRPLKNGAYQIVSGHRRWLAAQKAGLPEVPCLVENLSDEQVAEDNIVINIQREGIQPLELARMVKDYMDHFNKKQFEAARTFGKSDPWVSELLGFLKLDSYALEKFKALNLGWDPLRALKQLPPYLQKQIADELTEGKLKPENVQKRCNQLRFSGTVQHKSNQASSEQDPLAAIWEPLRTMAMATGEQWGVNYGPQAIPGMSGVTLPAWHFWIPNRGLTPKADLKRWFLKMAEAMGDTKQEEGAFQQKLAAWAPANEAEMRQLAQGIKNIRLPKTPEEEAELEDLSIQGPGPVYGWIYGSGSYYANKVANKSWKEIGFVDSVLGLSETLAGAKELQHSEAFGAEPAKPELDPKLAAMIARRKAQRMLP